MIISGFSDFRILLFWLWAGSEEHRRALHGKGTRHLPWRGNEDWAQTGKIPLVKAKPPILLPSKTSSSAAYNNAASITDLLPSTHLITQGFGWDHWWSGHRFTCTLQISWENSLGTGSSVLEISPHSLETAEKSAVWFRHLFWPNYF